MIPTDSQINAFLSTMEFEPGTIVEKIEIPINGFLKRSFLMFGTWNPVTDRYSLFTYTTEKPQPIKVAAEEI